MGLWGYLAIASLQDSDFAFEGMGDLEGPRGARSIGIKSDIRRIRPFGVAGNTEGGLGDYSPSPP